MAFSFRKIKVHIRANLKKKKKKCRRFIVKNVYIKNICDVVEITKAIVI